MLVIINLRFVKHLQMFGAERFFGAMLWLGLDGYKFVCTYLPCPEYVAPPELGKYFSGLLYYKDYGPLDLIVSTRAVVQRLLAKLALESIPLKTAKNPRCSSLFSVGGPPLKAPEERNICSTRSYIRKFQAPEERDTPSINRQRI